MLKVKIVIDNDPMLNNNALTERLVVNCRIINSSLNAFFLLFTSMNGIGQFRIEAKNKQDSYKWMDHIDRVILQYKAIRTVEQFRIKIVGRKLTTTVLLGR